jgi:CheY-like chemotaxis protein
VRVRDNGVGIEHALLGRIFDLFVQAERPSDRARAGIGIGLTLAKRLVDLHGGTIEAHSAGNALGSEFVVRLPLLPAGAIPAKPKAAKPAAARTPRRILIVDDNEDSAGALEMLLQAQGHATKVIGEGRSIVAEARALKAEVVVLDIGLPDMEGYEAAKMLRRSAATRDVLMVAVTGYGREADVKRSRAAGIDAHLTKPVDLDAFLDLILRPRKKKRGSRGRVP